MKIEDPLSTAYHAVSLDPLLNAGADILGTEARPALGRVSLRGLPFEIGSDLGRCYVAFGEDFRTAASIPIGEAVRSVVIAHRLLDSPIQSGGPVGTPVADFRFVYVDGSDHEVTVRDRFEIATLPVKWGQLPFRAMADTSDRLPPRYKGRYEDSGIRQTEAGQAWPRDYWLWAWLNPRPQRILRSIEIASRGPRFLIAGVCLGTADEHPLRLPGARTVRIDIGDQADAGRPIDSSAEAERIDYDDHLLPVRAPIDLRIAVDRGVSTFAYTVSAQSTEDFLIDPLAGFGEPRNLAATPAYVLVAALPSATLTVNQGAEVLGTVRWADVLTDSDQAAGPAKIRLVDPGRNWVRTSFLDADSGQPLACRVHFRSPDGVPFAPHGHHAHVGSDLGTWHIDVGGDVRLGQASYAYVEGACEGWLPRGEVIVDVAHGFEYEPLRSQVTIAPGQRDLTLRLKRMSDLRARRWFSGDTHVHFLSTQGAQLEARGEDLSVVNLLLSQWGHLFTNTEEFTGAPMVSRDGQTIVYASQENRQHMLGHLTLLGLKRPVMPWCSDGAEEAELGGTLEATLSEWADRCHEQGGTVIVPHLPNPNGEPAALIATGRVDGVEILEGNRYNHSEYYRYLNGGYRLPLVGGTDKMSSDVPVGLYRTYVNIPPDEEFTYESWCRNLARGRTFLSSGPLINFKAAGAIPGETIRVGAGGTVEVEAEVVSILPVHTLEIIQNGDVVASTGDPRGARRLSLRASLQIGRDSWIAARAGGLGYYDFVPHRDLWGRGIMAHTSPVYVTCGDQYRVFSDATAQYMLTLIEGSLTYIEELSAQHPDGHVTHHHGQHDHKAHLSRPLLQARDAILRRRRDELGQQS